MYIATIVLDVKLLCKALAVVILFPRIMTNGMMAKFNMDGNRGKIAFRKTITFHVVVGKKYSNVILYIPLHNNTKQEAEAA